MERLDSHRARQSPHVRRFSCAVQHGTLEPLLAVDTAPRQLPGSHQSNRHLTKSPSQIFDADSSKEGSRQAATQAAGRPDGPLEVSSRQTLPG